MWKGVWCHSFKLQILILLIKVLLENEKLYSLGRVWALFICCASRGVCADGKLSGKLSAPPGEMPCLTLCIFSPQWKEGLMKPCWWKMYCAPDVLRRIPQNDKVWALIQEHTPSLAHSLQAGSRSWAITLSSALFCGLMHSNSFNAHKKSLRSVRSISPFTRWASGGTERWNHKPKGSDPEFTPR